MTKVRRPYSRVYWEVIDDPKFEHVWDDDRALATWLRLLVGADMAWPASATLPYNVQPKGLARLVDAGLVDRQAGGRYRIHGLDRERSARSARASDAANTRWDDEMPPHPASTAEGMRPHPVGSAEGMPSQDEPSRAGAEQSRDEPRQARARDDGGSAEPYATLERLTRYPIPRFEPSAIRAVDALVDRRGVDAVVEAARAVAPALDPQPPAPWPLVAAIRNRLEPIAPAGAAQAPKAKPKGLQPDIEEVRRALAR